MEKLGAKFDAYFENPQDILDISGMNLGAVGARRVAELIPKW
jgi:hypothetical protein